MTIRKETIERIEHLAKLSLNTEDVLEFATRLSKVFDWIDQLQEVDISNIEPLVNPVMNLITTTPMREDKVDKPNSEEDVLSNAPSTEYNYLLVPKTVD